jgi:hypothetical protein
MRPRTVFSDRSRCGKLFGSLLVSRAGHGIDNCDGDRHLYVEAGGQKHTQWLAPVSRAASPYPSLKSRQIVPAATVSAAIR